MLRNLLLVLILAVFAQVSRSQVLQNLVRNSSFEVYKGLPSDLGQVENATYWSSPTASTPDFFHRRSKSEATDVPKNKMGSTKARTGYAYAGIYVYTSRYSKRNFREYLQVQLKQPMYPGETYCIKAHVYLSESSNRALGELGVAASRGPIQKDHKEPIAYLKPELMISQDRKVLDKREWVEVSAEYEAVGGERYLVLGNFSDDRSTRVSGAIEIDSFRNPHVDFAYYFIDDICVTSLRSNHACDCGSYEYETNARKETIVLDVKMKRQEYRINRETILKGVEFEPKKALFLEGSDKVLDNLVAVMKLNPQYKFEVSGHTHDKGDPEENYNLSVRRAKTVCDYLMASGIPAERLKYRGYGQARPVTLNTTKEGRGLNERIQVKRLE
ncbi:MAG: OmpA family protein [Saprospiraceae bacterium]|nr:OmpA family protein [Saprospiraceae bacterium]